MEENNINRVNSTYLHIQNTQKDLNQSIRDSQGKIIHGYRKMASRRNPARAPKQLINAVWDQKEKNNDNIVPLSLVPKRKSQVGVHLDGARPLNSC